MVVLNKKAKPDKSNNNLKIECKITAIPATYKEGQKIQDKG